MPSKKLSGDKSRKSRSMSWLILAALGLALVIGLLTFAAPGLALAASSEPLVKIPDTVLPDVAKSKKVGETDTNKAISLTISLKLRNADALKNLVNDISNEKSINYRRHLTVDQVQNSFAPTQESYDAVINYLRSAGFKIDRTYRHHMLISFSGTISQIESTFHVQVNDYVNAKGDHYFANANDPSLPQSIAAYVQGIGGMENNIAYSRSPMTVEKLKGVVYRPDSTCPDSSGADSNYYDPTQLWGAYNFRSMINKGFVGDGQSIALFEVSRYNSDDLKGYFQCYGGSRVNVQNIQTSTSAPDDSGASYVLLDAETIAGTDQYLNQLRIYNATNDWAGILGEWSQIVSDNVPVVSTGWGVCEQSLPANSRDSEANLFLMAAAQGQTIIAASGDSGSSGCFNGDITNNTSPNKELAVNDPASQPYVTSVGGTSLSINESTKAYVGEAAWNNTDQLQPPSGGAGGGGISSYWPHPSWQNAPGTNANVNRQVPDVSLLADPARGYLVYCSSVHTGCDTPGFYAFGGTSAAAAMWAAFIALANQQSVASGGYNLGFINPLLYQIASSEKYGSDFHDVTSGNNDYLNMQGGQYPATSGYDMATGLGSMDVVNLANDLVSLANASKVARKAPASKTWYFAEGSVGGGGGFQEFITLYNPDPKEMARVDIMYLIQGQSFQSKYYWVEPGHRYTVNVNAELGLPQATQYALSAIVNVTSGPAIVAERPMYFNYRGIISSGTDVLGVTSPGTNYYFPMADTRQDDVTQSWTYISILNPSETDTANVTITYYDGACGASGQPACKKQVVQVGALQRGTGTPTAVGINGKVAVKVSSDRPIVVERPMYIKTNIATAGGTTTGAASQIGATNPATSWYFAQGNTASQFQQYFVFANYSAQVANATVKLTYSDGTSTLVTVTVNPFKQYTLDVNQSNAGHPTTVGAEITSNNPIVVTRQMFFHYGSLSYSGYTDVVGTSQTKDAYSFAEGFVTSTFAEYINVLNPTDNDETVVVTYFGEGRIFQQQFVVKAHSVRLIDVNKAIVPFGSGVNSSTVQALSGTIVAERVMYFGKSGNNGGTDVIGYTGN